MNKKIVISATDSTMRKLKTFAGKKVGAKAKMVVTAKEMGLKARKIAVKAEKGNDIYKNKKTVTSATDNTILKLKILAKKKEGVRSKLVVTAKQLASTAKEKENVRSKLAVTAKKLASTAKEAEEVRRRLAVTAKEKESIRGKLAVVAKQLAITAKEREEARRSLMVTAKNLNIKAKQLAKTAEEKEYVRGKLEVTAKQLAATAEDKEYVRSKLEVTAKQLATTADEKEEVRSKLAVTAKQLATTAEEKEEVRSKLAVTAKQLATTAEEKEEARSKLAVTAKQLAATAEEKEEVRSKLAVIAKQLAATAEENEDARSKLAITAKEKESARRELAITAKKLEVTAQELALVAKERESISKYSRSLIEASLDPLVTISSEGKITDVNAATIKVTGVSRDKLIGTDFSNYFTEPKKALLGYKEVFREGSVTDYPLTIQSQKGKLTDVLYNASVYKDDKGKVIGIFAAARDVTETKKANELLAVTAKKLAVTAQEAEQVRRKLAVTAKEKEDVRNKLVETAKELAENAKKTELMNIELRKLDVAKDEFVSIASHQLRTPLTALKGYAGMLLDGDAGAINDKQHEYLVEIKNANDRMIALITALLNVSRVDLGVFIVEPELIDLKKIASEALNDLKIKIDEKKLQIKTTFDENVPSIMVDLNIVRMIFQNLFSNAVKYIHREGEISINIKKDGSDVLISVSDTGYGIPKNVQANIFTKMFRADNARIKDPEGTGLGLYIIKSTLEKTGGKIWFESVENKGSTFFVTIPLAGMKKKEGTKRLELK